MDSFQVIISKIFGRCVTSQVYDKNKDAKKFKGYLSCLNSSTFMVLNVTVRGGPEAELQDVIQSPF